MSAAIAFSGVTKRYGATDALRGLTLDVRRGEMFGLIGADGAGKTTAIRLMCGLLRPDGGEVRVLGRDPVRDHRYLTERVGYLSQRFSLYGDLTVDENVAFFAEIHGLRRYQSRRDQLLDMTQLAPFRRRRADRLSGGMKQKLALACTLVHEPELLLLDEPTTGVDAVSRREFWDLLEDLRHTGLTAIVATPYMDEAMRCDRVALMQDGALLAVDAPAAVAASFGRTLFAVEAGDRYAALVALRRYPHTASVFPFGATLHYTDARDAVPPAAVSAGVRAFLESEGLADVRVIETAPTIEDSFMARMGAPRAPGAEGHGR